jgi:tetratricopeptide (TPR) repeat protein
VFLVLLLAGCSQTPVKPLGDSPEWLAAQKKAQFHDSAANMGRARAEDIERFLQENPDDLLSHKRLLIFYTENGTRFYDPKVALAARRRHVLWMIEHHPDDEVLGMADGVLSPAGPPMMGDAAGYAEAKKQWSALAGKPDASAAVRANAAAAEKLADPAQQHQPVENKALELYDQGDTDGAQKAAWAALGQSPADGTTIFQANMVLGLAAMRKGDRKAAEIHLAKAGEAPATPELANFEQPVTYRLPSWLLKDGEREPVIQFLQRFAKTSVVDREELLASVELIRKGLKPAWFPGAGD